MTTLMLLTPEEVAETLQVSRRQVLLLLRSGALPGTKIGRAWRVAPEDLYHFIHQSKKEEEHHPHAHHVSTTRVGEADASPQTYSVAPNGPALRGDLLTA